MRRKTGEKGKNEEKGEDKEVCGGKSEYIGKQVY